MSVSAFEHYKGEVDKAKEDLHCGPNNTRVFPRTTAQYDGNHACMSLFVGEKYMSNFLADVFAEALNKPEVQRLMEDVMDRIMRDKLSAARNAALSQIKELGLDQK